MFKIFADGHLLYEPLNDDLIVTSPKLTLEMGKAGSLQFIVPPTNRYYNDLHQLKTKVSVEWDGIELFRGRVLSITRAFNNLRTIYCEGDLAYLLDSVQKGDRYEGKAHDLFKKIIANHNSRIKDPEKQFTVGDITIENRDVLLSGESEEIQDAESGKFNYRQIAINAMSGEWQKTMDYIESNLIDYTGGYLRTRRQNGVTYIDLVTEYGNTATQTIEFGKNMLDLTEEISAEDVFTVLIPLGDEGLTIAEVNGGSDELVDTAGVERFGRIVQSHSFDGVTSASTLMENAQRYLANNENAPITLTVTAVDMHFVDADAQPIFVGDKIRVKSAPHGMKDELTCTKIDYDLSDPSNNTYTFGTPKQTLTQRYRKDMQKQAEDAANNAADAAGGSGDDLQDDFDSKVDDLDDKVDDNYNDLNDKNDQLTDTVNKNHQEFVNNSKTVSDQLGLHSETLLDLNGRMSKAEADVTVLTDEQQAQVKLNAKYDKNFADLEVRATATESSIKAHAETLEGHKSSLELLATQTEALAKMDATFEDNLASITARVDANQSSIELNTKALGKAQANIELLSTATESLAQMDATLDGKIASVKAIADANGTAIELKADKLYVDTEVSKIDSKTVEIGKVADKNTEDIAAIRTTVNEHGQSLTEINTTVTNISSDVITLGKDKASKTYVNGQIEIVDAEIQNLQAEFADIDELITKKVQSLTSHFVTVRADIIYQNNELVATQQWVKDQEYMTLSEILESKLASQSWVENKGYATESWVEKKGYVTDVATPISNAIQTVQEWVKSLDYVSTSTLAGYKFATRSWVEEQLKSYSKTDHNHDTTYVTHTEFSTELGSKADKNHSHSGYAKSSHTHSIDLSVSASHSHSVRIDKVDYTTTNGGGTLNIKGSTGSGG